MNQIIMRVEAEDGAEGNVGEVRAILNGESCRIDWGDGHKPMLCAETTEWLYGMHIYSRKCTSRQVLIKSETGNIIGMIADASRLIFQTVHGLNICISIGEIYSTLTWRNANDFGLSVLITILN